MNWDLYNKYGEYNKNGDYIDDHEKWHYYAQRPKLYRKKKILAWLCLCLMPMIGIIVANAIYEEMGISIF